MPAPPPARAPRRASAGPHAINNAGTGIALLKQPHTSKVAGSTAMVDQPCCACLFPHTLTGMAEPRRQMRCIGRARQAGLGRAGTWLRSAASAASSASTAASAAGSAGEGSAGAAPGSSRPTGTCRLLASAAVSNAASRRARRACSCACSAAEACAPGTATRLQNRTGCRHLESCGWGALPVSDTEVGGVCTDCQRLNADVHQCLTRQRCLTQCHFIADSYGEGGQVQAAAAASACAPALARLPPLLHRRASEVSCSSTRTHANSSDVCNNRGGAARHLQHQTRFTVCLLAHAQAQDLTSKADRVTGLSGGLTLTLDKSGTCRRRQSLAHSTPRPARADPLTRSSCGETRVCMSLRTSSCRILLRSGQLRGLRAPHCRCHQARHAAGCQWTLLAMLVHQRPRAGPVRYARGCLYQPRPPL
jgi:hypothetical protein